MSADGDDLTSSDSDDSEYIPPVKILKEAGEHSDTQTDSSDDDLDSDNIDEEINHPATQIASRKSCAQIETSLDKNLTSDMPEATKKQHEDAIWDDFLKSVERPQEKKLTETISVVKTYTFAGEEIAVTESQPIDASIGTNIKLPNTAQTNSALSPPSTGLMQSNGSSLSNHLLLPNKRSSSGTVLGSAINKLKSLTADKAPKLTTLEKSRLDWQTFVKNENIEDDLRSYNKGKHGYLERQAFMDRTCEREYIHQKETQRKSSTKS